MHRNITIDENAYNLLASLKTGPRDSFTKVILRHVRKPADTCGELLESFKGYVPPVEVEDIDKFITERGRRSKRK
jgi:predicted CopG family antitoxin